MWIYSRWVTIGFFYAMSKLSSEIIAEKEASFENNAIKRQVWDQVESLFHNVIYDAESLEADSKVFDPKLATLTIERAYRVMSQLPTGKIKGISTNDLGDAKLKNLLLDKYVVPNANAQFDFLTKLRLVDMYSNVYGSFFVLVDQDVKPNGYVGPDMWLLNMRDVFLPVGAISLRDADYVIIRTWQPLSFFENLSKQPGFKNISKIVTKLKGLSGSKQNRDAENMSKREENQYPKADPAKNKGFFEVLTRFEKDRWVDICVDADEEFRDQKNPHDNGELPVIQKYSLPLIDDAMGFGDFERGASLQNAINANWNLYLDALKMSIFPPVLVNKDMVASPSSIQNIPSAQWLVRGNSIDNAIRPVNLSPQGISTFNNTYQVGNAALQGLFGSSDTSISKEVDSTLGKTPQALQMQAQRENTRDNADRFYMEQFVSEVMKKMCNLMSKKQTGAIQFRMFPEEIEQIAREYPEIKESYDENTGKLTVKKGKKSTLYDYEVVSGSTYAMDQKSQQENLQQLMDMYLKAQSPTGNQLKQILAEEGYNFKFGELFKKLISNSGIQDWDKILEEMTEQEKGDNILNSDMAQFQQVLAKAQAQGGQMNGVPPMPDQQMQPQPQIPQGMEGGGGMQGF